MKLYDHGQYCPKCGSEDLGIKWKKASKGRSSAIDGDREVAEHLRRECHDCEFAWNEAPLDSVEPAPIEDKMLAAGKREFNKWALKFREANTAADWDYCSACAPQEIWKAIERVRISAAEEPNPVHAE